ncbi:MAG: ACT domain-containing protein [Firmicutes bacterium]|nr:ACT domain-containing protein [Bacillota bacterium]
MNVSKETENYVLSFSSIKDALKKGLINYSKLSRQIIKDTELNPKDFDAVLVALRRLEYKLRKKKSFEKQIRTLLKNTKLEIKNKMMVCIIEKNVFHNNVLELQKDIKGLKGDVRVVEGVQAITMITSQEFEELVDNYFKLKIIKKTKNLIEIILRSPESLEEVPGVMGYLYSLFAEQGINIVETMSCWTDTIFIIEKRDLDKTIKMLTF